MALQVGMMQVCTVPKHQSGGYMPMVVSVRHLSRHLLDPATFGLVRP